jgi:hypothetical protein
MEVGSKAKFVGHFLPELSSSANRGLERLGALQRAPRSCSMGAPGVDGGTEGQCNTGLGAYGATRPLYPSTIYQLQGHIAAGMKNSSDCIGN